MKRIHCAFLSSACLLVSTLALSTPIQAEGLDLNPDELRGGSSKQPVSVLQNRFFLKAWRPEAGLAFGSLLNEAYTKTALTGVRLSLFPSEWVGAEVQYFKANVSDSSDRKALNKLQFRPKDPSPENDNTIITPDPEVNPVSSMMDVNVVAAPFYGKLNFMDMMIVYADIYATFGMSRVETSQGSKNAVIIGGGQRFYIGKSWSLRVDFRDRTFNEQRAGQSSRKHSMGIDLGAGYFFF